MASRLDAPNDPAQNGEILLQKAILGRLPKREPLVIFDVGANTGQWSVGLLRELSQQPRPSVELHVFEPSPASFHALAANLSPLAHSVRLTCNQYAVSNFTGVADFSIVAPLSQVNTLAPLEQNSVLETITVSCVSLDDYCLEKDLACIHLVKVDTEGNDFRVLEGARTLLRDGRVNYLQFEYNHRWIPFRNYLRDVFDLLEPFDYAIGKITAQGVEFYERWDPDLEKFLEGNYLLCRESCRPLLPSVRWWAEA
jgi:FkbM family methyltransferase